MGAGLIAIWPAPRMLLHHIGVALKQVTGSWRDASSVRTASEMLESIERLETAENVAQRLREQMLQWKGSAFFALSSLASALTCRIFAKRGASDAVQAHWLMQSLASLAIALERHRQEETTGTVSEFIGYNEVAP